MHNKIRLVIADIDSTLVDSKRNLTKKTKEILDCLHAHGVYLGIASGRPLDELSKNAKKWGLQYDFDFLIGMNGSEVWDNLHQKEYSYFKLKKEWIKEIIDLIVVMKDVEEMYAEENAKIMFRVKEEIMPEIEKYIEKHPSPYYKGFKTQTTLMEFADRRVSKGFALQKLCEMNNIALEDVAAFGDTTNDNDMIAISGTGVCMCNGSDDTKAIADFITEKSNDEDGLAYFIEEHYLKPYGWY